MLETLAAVFGCAVAGLILGYTAIKRGSLRAPSAHPLRRLRRISVHELGQIEGELRDLVRVLVMCNKVQDPRNALRKAVEKNFARNVKYIFLISSRHADKELTGYFTIFETLAKIHIARSRTELAVSDLVEIMQLGYKWDDYPYVFYQMGEGNNLHTIAFRGTDRGEGIATFYEQVDPHYAHTIAVATLADGPQPLRDLAPVNPLQFKQRDIRGKEMVS